MISLGNIMDTIKQWIRSILLRTARDLYKHKSQGPILRNTKQFITKEINIPAVISISITALIVYFMIFLPLGLRYDNMIAVFILVMVILFAFISEIRKEEAIANNNDAIVLICFILIIGILTMQIAKEYISILAFPISAFVVMGVMLINPRTALVYGIILSIIAGLFENMNFELFFTLFCSALVVLQPARNIRSRSDFVTIGIRVIAANSVIITFFYLLNAYDFTAYRFNLYYSLLNGSFTIIILLVIMPIFEKVFSRTTNIKLIELSDFNNPLLKDLMLEAPGTYHHSIMTASIAENAAVAINEDSILARVCAYYHDIGKIKNPQYFIENQSAGQNPHDPLTPAMSALILSSHVKDGVVLAKQYNLDEAIINAIKEHHGTSFMPYFYSKAAKINPEIDKNSFRYEGPKPRSKITAIMMLADSAEAACRAIDDISSSKIRDIIERIFKLKFEDGQFEECPITIKELNDVKESIATTLLGMYHARIPYADNNEKEKEKRNNS